ncbi:hypothetical protein ACQ27_gp084 [Klebsiella phage K64-1]|uniref:hypothetical protein n=1 Tax=Klebsiella phage K64-1 TaxID=1439894 RepID=UPI00248BB62E|nr:hypothetical protein ACQ27_gp084 [Klebsiella phage K64-1]
MIRLNMDLFLTHSRMFIHSCVDMVNILLNMDGFLKMLMTLGYNRTGLLLLSTFYNGVPQI